jgi:hypothetical protein
MDTGWGRKTCSPGHQEGTPLSVTRVTLVPQHPELISIEEVWGQPLTDGKAFWEGKELFCSRLELNLKNELDMWSHG